MSMALKADVERACRNSGMEKPVDLAHLSSITMGDSTLEKEVLKMFSAQLPQFEQMMRTANTPDEIERVAHTIKGAARSIGAFKLADIANFIEDKGLMDVEMLQAEMAAVENYISEIS